MAERPDKSRAWGVLAVTLALMALVAALSSATSHPAAEPTAASTKQRDASTTTLAAGSRSAPRNRNGRPSRAAPLPGAADHLGTTSGTTSSGIAPSGALTLDAPAVEAVTAGAATSSGPAGAVAAGSAPLHTTPASDPLGTTPASDVRPGSTGASAASTPSGGATRSGTVGPARTASFPVAGGGPITAQASWTGTAVMELGISCPDGVSAARTGSSTLSVETDDSGGGTCTVTLALGPGESGSADYRVTVEASA